MKGFTLLHVLALLLATSSTVSGSAFKRDNHGTKSASSTAAAVSTSTAPAAASTETSSTGLSITGLGPDGKSLFLSPTHAPSSSLGITPPKSNKPPHAGKPQYLVTGATHAGVIYFGPEGQQYPAYSAWAKYISKHHDRNGMRYRFQFGSYSLTPSVPQNPLESAKGLRFIEASQHLFGLSANWQCWLDKDTKQWTFDISEVLGIAGREQITKAVNEQLGLPQGSDNPPFEGL